MLYVCAPSNWGVPPTTIMAGGTRRYQKDVPAATLARAAKRVVESCVHFVGADLNTASADLLAVVSGIGWFNVARTDVGVLVASRNAAASMDQFIFAPHTPSTPCATHGIHSSHPIVNQSQQPNRVSARVPKPKLCASCLLLGRDAPVWSSRHRTQDRQGNRGSPIVFGAVSSTRGLAVRAWRGSKRVQACCRFRPRGAKP